MKKYAIVSYNMYGNFTNYGSALQTYALYRKINEIAPESISAIVLDYCPDVLKNKDVLNPIENMWDVDAEAREMCKLTMPAIKINYQKFKSFYKSRYDISKYKYTSENFNDSFKNEHLDGYICGSDTIWCIREFEGFDDGYYANYPVMKNSHTISYAASFGDVTFTEEEKEILKSRIKNYKAISIRESDRLDFIRNNTSVLVRKVIDPTLLLTGNEYNVITEKRLIDEPYILLYTRRYNKDMEEYADKLAERYGYIVVEVSLRAINKDKHIMFYEAGVEEFLSLTKYAEFVVTNSFHGAIFSIQMHTNFTVFSREQADTKIDEMLSSLGLIDRKKVSNDGITEIKDIDFDEVEKKLSILRRDSIDYLKKALELAENN